MTFSSILCWVYMIGNELEMLSKFLKLNTPIFFCFESEDAYVFILYFYDRLHKFGNLLSAWD